MFIVILRSGSSVRNASDTSRPIVPEPPLFSVPVAEVVPQLVQVPDDRHSTVACVASIRRSAMATLLARAVIRTCRLPSWCWRPVHCAIVPVKLQEMLSRSEAPPVFVSVGVWFQATNVGVQREAVRGLQPAE